METIKQTILCVDDNEDSLELLTYIFEQDGFEVKTCDSLEGCLPLIRQKDFVAVILDNRFENETSLEVCKEIRLLKPQTPIIYYSAEVRQPEIDQAIEAGASIYLKKPDDFDKLIETVSRLIQGTLTEV